jgi:hypothetical protein
MDRIEQVMVICDHLIVIMGPGIVIGELGIVTAKLARVITESLELITESFETIEELSRSAIECFLVVGKSVALFSDSSMLAGMLPMVVAELRITTEKRSRVWIELRMVVGSSSKDIGKAAES